MASLRLVLRRCGNINVDLVIYLGEFAGRLAAAEL